MNYIFVDCSLGISGDMLASALFDVGVPESIFKENLDNIKIDKNFNLTFREAKSNGMRGIRCIKSENQEEESHRSLNDIKKIIYESNFNNFVKEKSIEVFEVLAKAESIVHGLKISEVHFHELGSIDSLIDVVNVCSAIDYLKPEIIYFEKPPAGSGIVSTSHGMLSVPVPTVLEISKQKQIPLTFYVEENIGEISTPTGMALIAIFADKIGKPKYLNINNIGIGLGSKDISRPNLLKVILLSNNENNISNRLNKKPIYESIFFQEAWIDDATPEDIAVLVEKLRNAGAIEVVSNSVDMKKNRKGICIKVIVNNNNVESLRDAWFNFSTTLGFREQEIYRWILPRRLVKYKTSFGEINVKQALRPNNKLSIKIEHEDICEISLNSGFSIEEVRQKIFMELSKLYEIDDWSY